MINNSRFNQAYVHTMSLPLNAHVSAKIKRKYNSTSPQSSMNPLLGETLIEASGLDFENLIFGMFAGEFEISPFLPFL